MSRSTPTGLINFWSWDRGSKQHYMNPLLLLLLIIYYCKDASYTSGRLSTEAWNCCSFIELHICIFILICRQKRTHLNPGPEPAKQPIPLPQSPPPPRWRGKPQNPWVKPWILQREEKGWYSNLLADLIQTVQVITVFWLVGCLLLYPFCLPGHHWWIPGPSFTKAY